MNEKLVCCIAIFTFLFSFVSSVPPTFAGVVLDETITNLDQWSTCFSGRYSQAGFPLSLLISNCSAPNWIFACRQIGVPTYDVLAQVDYAFISALADSSGTVDNGAVWYRNDSRGIGFSAGAFNLDPCDIDTPGQLTRLCWRLDVSGDIIIGGRCAGNIALGGGSFTFVRELLFDPCRGVANGVACDDNNACTTGETCQDQECVGTPTAPPTPGDCFNVGQCDPVTGIYAVTPSVAASPCEDGDLCTVSDVCNGAGTCLSGTPLVCPVPPGQCFQGGTCISPFGNCSYPPRPLGTICTDGLFCTDPDQCDGAGNCVPIANRTCISFTQCLEPGVCNEITDQCDFAVSPDNTPCFISNQCVNTSVCIAGTCTAQTGTICPPVDQCIASSECNALTGACDVVLEANGTPCDDLNLCTSGDQCMSGICTGTPTICTALGPCYEPGVCNPGTGLCTNPFSSGFKPCTDGNACTNPDFCNGLGSCVPGPAVFCSPIGQCDVAGVCNPSLGCPFTPLPDGTSCTDGDVCTLDDECMSGSCVAGPLDLYNPYCFNFIVPTTGGPGDAAADLFNIFA